MSAGQEIRVWNDVKYSSVEFHNARVKSLYYASEIDCLLAGSGDGLMSVMYK